MGSLTPVKDLRGGPEKVSSAPLKAFHWFYLPIVILRFIFVRYYYRTDFVIVLWEPFFLTTRKFMRVIFF